MAQDGHARWKDYKTRANQTQLHLSLSSSLSIIQTGTFMPPSYISSEHVSRFDWLDLLAALEAGYAKPKGAADGSFISQSGKALLTRSAWIDEIGAFVKTITYCPSNLDQGLHPVQGTASLFHADTGQLVANFDPDFLTQWKTAGDSVLAARRLARADSKNILIIGAGQIARGLVMAYRAAYPGAKIHIWNRTAERAQKVASELSVRHTHSLKEAIEGADIVSSATGSKKPLIHGAALKPGQHIDLVGSFFPDAREVDDEALQNAKLFVNCKDAALGAIGEIALPLESGAIKEADLLSDHYAPEDMRRTSPQEITMFKNCGSTHANLIAAAYMAKAVHS